MTTMKNRRINKNMGVLLLNNGAKDALVCVDGEPQAKSYSERALATVGAGAGRERICAMYLLCYA